MATSVILVIAGLALAQVCFERPERRGRLRRFFCGLRGHKSALPTFGYARISLTCPDCGHESKGWDC